MTDGAPQRLELSEQLPGLNELVDAAKRSYGRGRRRHDGYSMLKRRWTGRVAAEARAQGLRPVKQAWLRFTWIETSRRRDPDNVAAAGRKLILDGLVTAGVLQGDGWRHVAGWEDRFQTGESGGVVVELWEVG